ncbi:MAG: hypothetical protein M3460_31035 [Actinomycetota bacterium]|nr:hypothetical protein [Actinomycetota bacterium]
MSRHFAQVLTALVVLIGVIVHIGLIIRWRCLPLTRTRRELLTCGFATPWRLPALCVPRDRAKRPYNLRDRLDERDIANLITAHRDGATAASRGQATKATPAAPHP